MLFDVILCFITSISKVFGTTYHLKLKMDFCLVHIYALMLYNCHVTHDTLLFSLTFSSGHVFCSLCSQNVSVTPEDGPSSAETCRSVTV